MKLAPTWMCFSLLVAGTSALGQETGSPAPGPAAPMNPVAAPVVADTWKGEIELSPAQKLAFIVHFTGSAAGTLDIPLQGVKAAPITDVTYSATAIKFTFTPGDAPAAKAVFDAKRDGVDPSKASGTLSQGGATLPLTFSKLAPGELATGLPKRSQHPEAPFPYTTREVKLPGGGENVTLAGTLMIPSAGKGPFCAVALVTGSGPQDRDETLMGHKPFLVLGDYLARNGVAVLRCDDRGVGKSTGDFAKATTLDFAADAEKMIDFLTAQPEIDAHHVGLIGHSEGATVAPIVASRRDDVAFIVMLAGAGVPGDQVLHDQMKAMLDAGAVSPDAAGAQLAAQAELLEMAKHNAGDEQIAAPLKKLIIAQAGGKAPSDQLDGMIKQQIAQMRSPWMQTMLKLDPRDYLRKVKCPVLALDGTLDTQVVASINLPEIDKALKEAGNPDVTIKSLDKLNHLFQHATTGEPGEYPFIEETFAPSALEVIGGWLKDHCARQRLTQ